MPLRIAVLALCVASMLGAVSSRPIDAGVAQQPSDDRAAAESSVTIRSGQWRLRGNFLTVAAAGRHPAALLLNKANGDRTAYQYLATQLARRGISSLRIDLRAHGESTNLGRFMPNAPDAGTILQGTSDDVTAALRFLRSSPIIDSQRVAVVGASYSAEAMAEAARATRHYAKAYVALSPGDFSETSADAIDGSGARWLVIRSARERSPAVKAAVDMVAARSTSVQLWMLDAASHATDVLAELPGLPARLADWIAAALR